MVGDEKIDGWFKTGEKTYAGTWGGIWFLSTTWSEPTWSITHKSQDPQVSR